MILRHRSHKVLLDACVLVPISLTDVLLRLAETPALYYPRWSCEILEEVRRALTRPPISLPPVYAGRRIQQMMAAFPEALVEGYEGLTGSMENHPGDRHVLAAAVAAGCDVIVTNNERHFPTLVLQRQGVDRLSADHFLEELVLLDGPRVVRSLHEIAFTTGRGVSESVARLAHLTPRFAQAVAPLVTSIP